ENHQVTCHVGGLIHAVQIQLLAIPKTTQPASTFHDGCEEFSPAHGRQKVVVDHHFHASRRLAKSLPFALRSLATFLSLRHDLFEFIDLTGGKTINRFDGAARAGANDHVGLASVITGQAIAHPTDVHARITASDLIS